MRRYFAAAAIAGLFGVAANAADAKVVSFELENIQFSDGGTASGTFSIEEPAGLVTAMNIYYRHGSAGVPSYHFTNADLTYNGFYPASPQGYEFACSRSEYSGCVSATGGASWFGATDWLYFGIGPRYGFLELDLVSPIGAVPDGVVVASIHNDNMDLRYSPVSFGGAIVPVPEPATWAIMLLGVLGVGAVLRDARRKPLGGAGAGAA